MSTPADYGMSTPSGNDLIRHGDDAITNNAIKTAAALAAARHWRGTLAAATDLDTVTEPGSYGVWSSSPNAPGSGVLEVAEIRTAAGVLSQVVQTFTGGSSQQIQTRFRGSTGWSGWTRIDGGAHLPAAAPAGLNADAVDPESGYSSLLVHSSTGATNLPVASAGLLETWVLSPSGFRPKLQRWTTADTNPGLWTRFFGSGGWSAWQRLDAGAVDVSKLATPAGSASAWKTVPIALTVGGSASTRDGEVAARVPVRLGARVNRWRVHIANVNPRFGTHGTSRWISGVWLGRASAGGGPSAVDQVQIANGGNISSTADGAALEHVTRWRTEPLEAGVDYLISYATTGTGTPIEECVGGGWTSPTGSDAREATGTWTAATKLPFHVWIEADVHPLTPVVAAFGDSLSSGVGATLPVYDSWLSQLCRRIGALPVHYTASGDTMQGWSDPDHYKWARWQHLSRPDAVIHAMGSNDVFNGADLATLQARHATTINLLRALVSPVIYGATILPRDGVTGSMEDVRRSYNTWLRSHPDTRQVIDMVPVISANDETITSGFSADGIHLNTAGYKAIADATPDTAPPTEVVEIGPDVAGYVSGSLAMSRVGATITLTMYGLTINNGSGTLYTLPERFRPLRTTYWGSGGGWLASGPRINISHTTGAMSAASMPTSQPLYNTITYIGRGA